MISSHVGKEPTGIVRRWYRKSKTYMEVSRPQAVIQYNHFMGGVDLTDRMIAQYPHAVKNKKFYMCIVFHFMNVAIINAWVFYQKTKESETPLLQFKSSIASTLIQLNINNRQRARPSTEFTAKKKRPRTKVIHEVHDGHGQYPIKIDYKSPPRYHERNCTRRTRYACKKCNENMCPECMEAFQQ